MLAHHSRTTTADHPWHPAVLSFKTSQVTSVLASTGFAKNHFKFPEIEFLVNSKWNSRSLMCVCNNMNINMLKIKCICNIIYISRVRKFNFSLVLGYYLCTHYSICYLLTILKYIKVIYTMKVRTRDIIQYTTKLHNIGYVGLTKTQMMINTDDEFRLRRIGQ